MKDKARPLTPRSVIRKLVIAARKPKAAQDMRSSLRVAASVIVSSAS